MTGFKLNKLSTLSTSLGALMSIPLLALVSNAIISPADDAFQNMAQTVLADYIINSLLLIFYTLIFACLFAIAPAWWCARYEFAGRRYLQWAMVFPLAVPAYVSAYIYTDALDYAGPVQILLRSLFGWQSPLDYWFFDVRSLIGASIMLALALYPYLYLLLRNTFGRQNDHLEHAAKLMGASSRQIFFRIHLPMARPALAIGCALIGMESLADFGTVHLFAVNTLTTAIYDSWLVYESLGTATKLSCMLLVLVISLVWLERHQRRQQKQFDSKGSHTLSRKVASTTQQCKIWIVCLTIITLGFLVPVATLIQYTLTYLNDNLTMQLWLHAQHTFFLAATAAIACTLIALLLNTNLRLLSGKSSKSLFALSSLGYAIPGTVLAIAVLIPLGFLDIQINQLLKSWNQPLVGLILSGTTVALLFAFVIRFSAIANGSIHSAYQQINANIDLAARTMNSTRARLFKQVHLPLLMPATVTALLLVFIECVKELPAALLLRPFDFETLSTYVYQFASDEQLEQGALAALLVVIVSLLPIAVLSRTQRMS